MDAPRANLEKALSACNGLLDEEAEAIGRKDLDALEEGLERKDAAIACLAKQIDLYGQPDSPDDPVPGKVQDVYNRLGENSSKLEEWMDVMDRDVALASRGRNRLKGVRRKYVTAHKGAYRKPGQSFEA